jgi:alpha-N-arabinofuranosidase
MDGPWQIGHMTATEYRIKAQEAASQMYYVDPTLKLIACGSSHDRMPTYLKWDRQVLEQCYEHVDGLSLHRYFGNTQENTGGDTTKYLAVNLNMERKSRNRSQFGFSSSGRTRLRVRSRPSQL